MSEAVEVGEVAGSTTPGRFGSMASTNNLFSRSIANPILNAEALSYPANTVFNPAVAQVDGETVLLMRVEDLRGISHLTVARSKDGVTNWQIDSQPSFEPNPEQHPEEVWGIEDPRVTWLPERGEWGIAYTSFSRRGPLVSMAVTPDFR